MGNNKKIIIQISRWKTLDGENHGQKIGTRGKSYERLLLTCFIRN